MRPFELNLLEEKVLRNYKRMDKATEVSLSIMVKKIQAYLKDRNIETTKEEALMLILLTMSNNRGPDMAIIIQRHINSCSQIYNEINEHLQTGNNEPVRPDPDKEEPKEPAEAVTSSELFTELSEKDNI